MLSNREKSRAYQTIYYRKSFEIQIFNQLLTLYSLISKMDEMIKKRLEEMRRRKSSNFEGIKSLIALNLVILMICFGFILIFLARLMIPAIEYSNSEETMLFFIFSFLNTFNCGTIILYLIAIHKRNHNYIISYLILNSIWIFVAILMITVIFGLHSI